MSESYKSDVIHAQRKSDRITFTQAVLAILLFFAAMNFKEQWYLISYFAFFALFLLNKGNIRLSGDELILCGFAISLLVFWPEARTSYSGILKQLTYPMLFVLGYNAVGTIECTGLTRDKPSAVNYGALALFVCAMSLGCFTHLLLNYLINFGAMSRYVQDFWTGELLSATGQAAIACLPIGLFCGLVFCGKSNLVRVASAAGLFIVLSYNLILAGRTIIVIVLIVLLVALCARLIYSRFTKSLIVLLVALLIVIGCIAAFQNDLFGIRTELFGSNLYNRFTSMGIEEDGRLSYRLQYLSLLSTYPWGGSNMLAEVGGYAHDLLLDVYNAGGIVAFTFMLAFIFKIACYTVQFLKGRGVAFQMKVLLLCELCAIALEFCVEPIIYGMPWLLGLFCCLGGMLARGCAAATVDRELIKRGLLK